MLLLQIPGVPIMFIQSHRCAEALCVNIAAERWNAAQFVARG